MVELTSQTYVGLLYMQTIKLVSEYDFTRETCCHGAFVHGVQWCHKTLHGIFFLKQIVIISLQRNWDI